jgi:ubiquitin
VLQGRLDIVWKHSDYRGLKKRIAAIRSWQEGLEARPPSTVDAKDSNSEVRHKPSRVSWSAYEQYGRKTPNRRRLSMPTSRPRPNSHQQAVPLYSILLTLPPIHLAFFTYLDRQLEQIDSFYLEREKEAQARSKALEIQLRELKDHRKIFYVSG